MWNIELLFKFGEETLCPIWSPSLQITIVLYVWLVEKSFLVFALLQAD